MGFLRDLFKKTEKRALHYGASVSDDYDRTKYSEEYQHRIAKNQGSQTFQLLDNFESFVHNIKPKWKQLLGIPKLLRPASRKLYLSLAESS